MERRQFVDSHEGLSPEAQELGQAIDEYKLRHRRRFVTYEETLGGHQVAGIPSVRKARGRKGEG